MQFQVPQFIEVEDKIFGPLTFKQFIYLLGAAGMGYIIWRVLPVYVAAPIALAIFALGAALAFFKYNGQPFILAVEHAFYYFLHTKLYLWSSQPSAPQTPVKQEIAASAAAEIYVPKLSESKLHELAWSLDIKERVAAGVGDTQDRAASPQENIVMPVRTARDALVR
jgi:hypothetical protein